MTNPWRFEGTGNVIASAEEHLIIQGRLGDAHFAPSALSFSIADRWMALEESASKVWKI